MYPSICNVRAVKTVKTVCAGEDVSSSLCMMMDPVVDNVQNHAKLLIQWANLLNSLGILFSNHSIL